MLHSNNNMVKSRLISAVVDAAAVGTMLLTITAGTCCAFSRPSSSSSSSSSSFSSRGKSSPPPPPPSPGYASIDPTSSSLSSSSSDIEQHPHHMPQQQQQQQQHNNNSRQLHRPRWVPMELVELAADDAHLTPNEFVRLHADVEAYTSCDDEGDDFHECDTLRHYLGPLKWLRLTNRAYEDVPGMDVHFEIWKDVWSRPRGGAVDLADKVSRECMRYYEEFMLEPRSSPTSSTHNDDDYDSNKCPTTTTTGGGPLVRAKVVPASFGLEGFEDAIWEAAGDLIADVDNNNGRGDDDEDNNDDDDGISSSSSFCRAITFVVAAPDLFTDPLLLAEEEEGGNGGRRGPSSSSSPQAEFEPDRFREFASSLEAKIAAFSTMEMEEEEEAGVPKLDEGIWLTPMHPLWKSYSSSNRDDIKEEGGVVAAGVGKACGSFPYPCVAVSADIEV